VEVSHCSCILDARLPNSAVFVAGYLGVDKDMMSMGQLVEGRVTLLYLSE